MVLLFDFSSMEPAEQIRAKQAAIKFLTTQMTASDSVAIMAYGVKLTTVQDFTSDRDALLSAINAFASVIPVKTRVSRIRAPIRKIKAVHSSPMRPSSTSSTPI